MLLGSCSFRAQIGPYSCEVQLRIRCLDGRPIRQAEVDMSSPYPNSGVERWGTVGSVAWQLRDGAAPSSSVSSHGVRRAR
jgi:hypothetical protein